jgi:hypothetical protein
MRDVLGVAADWLEHGHPADRQAREEADLYGDLLWAADSRRAYSQQSEDGFRLSVVGDGSALTYDIPGVDGGWLL